MFSVFRLTRWLLRPGFLMKCGMCCSVFFAIWWYWAVFHVKWGMCCLVSDWFSVAKHIAVTPIILQFICLVLQCGVNPAKVLLTLLQSRYSEPRLNIRFGVSVKSPLLSVYSYWTSFCHSTGDGSATNKLPHAQIHPHFKWYTIELNDILNWNSQCELHQCEICVPDCFDYFLYICSYLYSCHYVCL